MTMLTMINLYSSEYYYVSLESERGFYCAACRP